MPKIIKIPATTIPVPEQNWSVAQVTLDYVSKTGKVTLFNGELSHFSIVDNEKILTKEIPFVDVFAADEQVLVDVANTVDAASELVEEKLVEPVVEPVVEAELPAEQSASLDAQV